MGIKFKKLSEVLTWAKENYPGCSLSVKQMEENLFIVVVKRKDGAVLKEVVYVRKRD